MPFLVLCWYCKREYDPPAVSRGRKGRAISSTDLVNRWRQGDEAAAEELFALYAQKLTTLAERHLSNRLAQRVEGEDIVQSVFRTFFNRSARGEFQIRNSVEIWRLLVTITVTKVREQARRHTSAKRDMNAEDHSADEAWLSNAVASEPGPAEAAALLDQIEQLLDGLPEAYCEMLTLRLEGNSRSDIAKKLGVSRQTVYRVLNLMQQRLEGNA